MIVNCGVKKWKRQRSSRGKLHDDDDDALLANEACRTYACVMSYQKPDR